MTADRSTGDAFQSRAMLQRARDPVFVLSRHRRLRFANVAWERLTGRKLDDVYGLVCSRRTDDPLAQALVPPPEAMAGAVGRARRPAPPARVGPPWWDIVFLPLSGDDGLGWVIGRITVVGQAAAARPAAVPEALLQLRHRLPERFRFDLLDSDLPELHRAVEQARLASRSHAPLLLVGEPGSGKRWFARAIHHHGVTAERGFLTIDAAAVPPTGLAALLSLITSAAAPQVGTAYLRDVARLPRELQARLADWLHDHPADGPRVVAGLTRDATAEIIAGRLLPRLHLALSIQTITLPPLRDRADDLPRLAAAVLDRAALAGVPRPAELSADVLDALRSYSWPGNLRELDAVLAFAARQAAGGVIERGHLPRTVTREVGRHEAVAASPNAPPSPVLALGPLLEQMERRLIRLALRKAGGVKAEAARLLDISRPRLIRRMQELGIPGVAAKRPDPEDPTDEAPADRGG